jgi:pimeloyl-ACP methyl ester carboxylesterase
VQGNDAVQQRASGRSRAVVVRDGTRIHVLDRTPGGEPTDPAPSFLLVHGLASNATLWDGVAEVLVAAGHRVVAVDLRSHGRSDPSDQLDLETLTDDLLDVAAALELGRPVVVGQSWGGNVVVELAALAPHRVRAVAAVDGGTIDLSTAFEDADAAWAALAPPDWDVLAVPYPEVEATIRHRHPGWPEAGIRAQLANLAVRPDGTATAVLRREHHRAIVAGMLDHRPLDRLTQVEVPVLLLPVDTGDDDPSWAAGKRAAVERAADANPLVHVAWHTGRSHDVHAEAPDEVAERLLTALADGTFDLAAETPA